MKDTIKTKHMTGLVDKAIAKFDQNELRGYEKLFNTAYSVTTHSFLKFKLKMISFGQQYLDRDVCVNFIKLYE
jgi:hypothetical protein